MIRIDLGKDSLQSNTTNTRLSALLEKLKVNGLGANGPKKPKINIDLKGVLIAGVVAAIACLPHLFVAQYKSYIEGQHHFQMNSLKEKQEILSQEIAKYQSYQRELESYEKQKRLIQERLTIVRRLLESRGTPVNILDSIAQSLPHRSWLTQIDFKVNPEPGVTLSGHAYSNEEISDFVDKLTESVHLADVSLENVGVSRLGKELDVKLFEVKALPRGVFRETQKTADIHATNGVGTPEVPNPNAQTPTIQNGQ